jgi:UDP-GlcNAc3NAcA epimerase
MAKFLSIVGARPQFIKLGALSRHLRSRHTEVILHTGQHYAETMSGQFFKDLDIAPPDYNLEVGSGSHGMQTARMLSGVEEVLVAEQPDCVIVFGDTNSTLAGSLAAVKLRFPCAHVEAGLRSFNRSMPEEINRVITDHISDSLFAPTQAAVQNLEREGLSSRTFLTGDIMVDTLSENRERAAQQSDVLKRLQLGNVSYTLLTLHRPYNVDNPGYVEGVLECLAQLGDRVVFPVHPRTQRVMGISTNLPANTLITEPFGYLDFIQLEANAKRIVTDSGGIQKEAYLLGIPCVTLRPETEWVETIHAGWNLLADPSAPGFIETVRSFDPTTDRPSVFGAHVAGQMLAILEDIASH